MIYTNPRLSQTFPDWPWGSKTKTQAVFSIEQFNKRERCLRTVTHPVTLQPCKTRALTFSTKQRIVDGDDGKTYIACLTMYGHITFMQSNMQYQQESVHSTDEGYAAALALFN